MIWYDCYISIGAREPFFNFNWAWIHSHWSPEVAFVYLLGNLLGPASTLCALHDMRNSCYPHNILEFEVFLLWATRQLWEEWEAIHWSGKRWDSHSHSHSYHTQLVARVWFHIWNVFAAAFTRNGRDVTHCQQISREANHTYTLCLFWTLSSMRCPPFFCLYLMTAVWCDVMWCIFHSRTTSNIR